MTFIVASDRQNQMRSFTKELLAAFPGSFIYEYRDLWQVIVCVSRHRVDAVFLEAKTEHMDGLQLLRRLCDQYPKLAVYLLADSDEYQDEAMWDGAAGYLERPVTLAGLRDALTELSSRLEHMGGRVYG